MSKGVALFLVRKAGEIKSYDLRTTLASTVMDRNAVQRFASFFLIQTHSFPMREIPIGNRLFVGFLPQ